MSTKYTIEDWKRDSETIKALTRGKFYRQAYTVASDIHKSIVEYDGLFTKTRIEASKHLEGMIAILAIIKDSK